MYEEYDDAQARVMLFGALRTLAQGARLERMSAAERRAMTRVGIGHALDLIHERGMHEAAVLAALRSAVETLEGGGEDAADADLEERLGTAADLLLAAAERYGGPWPPAWPLPDRL
jgi:hypothetical protein